MSINALYLHIPFCHAKCAYCDFDSRGLRGSALERALSDYVPQLIDRIDAFGRAGALRFVETVYVGGGTPTVLGRVLADIVVRVCSWCDPVEVTCEANPESFDGSLANALACAGVTRISLGVQSLNDTELVGIGRLHTGARALEALRCARDAGFDVSCDLMCGLPGQTRASWQETLQRLIAERPCHVSVYPLFLEEGTPLARRAEREPALVPNEDFQADCMEESERQLVCAGFHRYEVASYAQPGHACRHNLAYWTGRGYLGIGRSAAGMVDRACADRLAGLFPGLAGRLEAEPDAARVRFVQRDDAAERFDFECLTEREAVAEDLMLGMRLSRGVAAADLEHAAHLCGSHAVDEAVRASRDLGLARWVDEGGGVRCLAPTERGWLLGNELYGIFWGLADPS